MTKAAAEEKAVARRNRASCRERRTSSIGWAFYGRYVATSVPQPVRTGPLAANPTAVDHMPRLMCMKKGSVVVKAELPGKKEDVEVNLQGNLDDHGEERGQEVKEITIAASGPTVALRTIACPAT